MVRMSRLPRIGLLLLLIPAFGAFSTPSTLAAPDQRTSFSEIAVPGTSLAAYRRIPSPEHAIRVANRQRPQIAFSDLVEEPVFSHGIPGVVTFDYDRDDDLDFYVTNGPGRPNSLYQNQLSQTGRVDFLDVGEAAGVGLASMDADGACAGDVDNDGYMDLYVLGNEETNHLLKNRGNGTFTDVSASAGDVGAGTYDHASCTMADFDGDALLDIAIANTFDLTKAYAIFAVPYRLNQPNQLLKNVDGQRFTDVSVSSGFYQIDVRDVPPGDHGPFSDITWSLAAVDYDQDGDTDIFTAGDQAAYPHKKYGGNDRGLFRVYNNNGAGVFHEVTFEAGTGEPSQHMGFSFGDYNFDGNLDVFSTSGGDFFKRPLPVPYELGDSSSRWFLQRSDGTFVDPRRSSISHPEINGADPDLGGLKATPWGWSTSSFDYDNDGVTDILYHGALDGMGAVSADNEGTLLRNKGPQALRDGFFPQFEYDDTFTRSGADHLHRTVIGMATGDLDRNGFVDVVSVAQSLKVGSFVRYADLASINYGSPFDNAKQLPIYLPDPKNPGILRPTGNYTTEGNLSVEVNNGNRNKSATIATLGSAGLTPGGSVNRDGVGAVVSFTPQNGLTAMRPVVAGSGFASQDALEGTFGMGKANIGTAEILWPGGIRNKLYDVRAGERLTLPEIPCSYTDTTTTFTNYKNCVTRALNDLTSKGHITAQLSSRLFSSAIRAFNENR
jgi:enediyne biosynthesis protein E4